jgi:HPt (histidine-containing phosphotransfer) domain-containing protein
MQEQSKAGAPTTWVVRPDPDLEDLIPSFVQNRRNELVEIRSALSKKDFEAIRRTAHTWKGICRPYGFVHLETLSRSLEGAGEREDASELKGIVEEIQSYLDNVRIVYDS